jgi:hypothetical protein
LTGDLDDSKVRNTQLQGFPFTLTFVPSFYAVGTVAVSLSGVGLNLEQAPDQLGTLFTNHVVANVHGPRHIHALQNLLKHGTVAKALVSQDFGGFSVVMGVEMSEQKGHGG